MRGRKRRKEMKPHIKYTAKSQKSQEVNKNKTFILLNQKGFFPIHRVGLCLLGVLTTRAVYGVFEQGIRFKPKGWGYMLHPLGKIKAVKNPLFLLT